MTRNQEPMTDEELAEAKEGIREAFSKLRERVESELDNETR